MLPTKTKATLVRVEWPISQERAALLEHVFAKLVRPDMVDGAIDVTVPQDVAGLVGEAIDHCLGYAPLYQFIPGPNRGWDWARQAQLLFVSPEANGAPIDGVWNCNSWL